jgi:hypothetical protein
LIGKYVALFGDNSVEFKVYLNEELHRLKEEVKKMSSAKDINGDEDMQRKVALVSERMESFKNQPIDDKMIQQVLQIQALAREIIL